MLLYFAPLEGITGYIYRNAHHKYFKGVDKYFTPFLLPNQNRGLGPKDIRDIAPEHNRGIPLVPQIMTNKSAHFLCAARELYETWGYEEVNLNLGCPSRTVTTKGKGAGFLGRREELNRFLEEVFSNCPVSVSIKTRLGVEQPEEFYALMDIFNQYPLKELIIHPRVQTDYYKNTPNRKMFAEALLHNQRPEMPICYNGDLFTRELFFKFKKEFPQTEHIMLGRGLIADPGLAMKLKEGEAPASSPSGDCPPLSEAELVRLRAFHDQLYHGYQEAFCGHTNVLFKMKEVWFYMIHSFPDGEKYLKKIQKASRFPEYETAVKQLFDSR